MYKEDYCSYEQAIKLRKLGFDWITDFYYWKANPDYPRIENYIEYGRELDWNSYDETTISAPILYIAQKWLREKFNVEVLPYCIFSQNKKFYTYNIMIRDYHEEESAAEFESYEQALSVGISRALELI